MHRKGWTFAGHFTSLLKLSINRRYQVREITFECGSNMGRLHASAFLRPNVLPIAFTYRS